MPVDDRLGLNNEKVLLPSAPESVQDDPKQPIRHSEPRLRMPVCQNHELLPQGQIFEEKFLPGIHEAGKRGKRHEQQLQRAEHIPVVADFRIVPENSAVRFGAMQDDVNI